MAWTDAPRQQPCRMGPCGSRRSAPGAGFKACPCRPRMASVRAKQRITTVDKTELAKLEAYLRRTFSNHNISVRARLKKTDSAEVYLADEFVGIIHVDDEDGDRSFNFTMAILDVDLED
jgi:hypothetical protein